METIGEVVKKMKEEGKNEFWIHLHKNYWSSGSIVKTLKDLEEVSPDLNIEEYMKEQDEEGSVDIHDEVHEDGMVFWNHME